MTRVREETREVQKWILRRSWATTAGASAGTKLRRLSDAQVNSRVKRWTLERLRPLSLPTMRRAEETEVAFAPNICALRAVPSVYPAAEEMDHSFHFAGSQHHEENESLSSPTTPSALDALIAPADDDIVVPDSCEKVQSSCQTPHRSGKQRRILRRSAVSLNFDGDPISITSPNSSSLHLGASVREHSTSKPKHDDVHDFVQGSDRPQQQQRAHVLTATEVVRAGDGEESSRQSAEESTASRFEIARKRPLHQLLDHQTCDPRASSSRIPPPKADAHLGGRNFNGSPATEHRRTGHGKLSLTRQPREMKMSNQCLSTGTDPFPHIEAATTSPIDCHSASVLKRGRNEATVSQTKNRFDCVSDHEATPSELQNAANSAHHREDTSSRPREDHSNSRPWSEGNQGVRRAFMARKAPGLGILPTPDQHGDSLDGCAEIAVPSSIFQTGSGKRIPISSAAVRRMQTIFVGEDVQLAQSTHGVLPSPNGAGRGLSLSFAEAQAEAIAPLADKVTANHHPIDEFDHKRKPATPSRDMPMEREENARNNRLREGVSGDGIAGSPPPLICGGQSKSIPISGVENVPPGIFHTGNGAVLEVSSIARQRAMSIFADDAAPSLPPGSYRAPRKGAGDLSADHGKENSNPLPAEGLNNASFLDRDVRGADAGLEAFVAPCVFQTGRGKPVSISAAARRRMQSMFADEDLGPSTSGRGDTAAPPYATDALETVASSKVSVAADTVNRHPEIPNFDREFSRIELADGKEAGMVAQALPSSVFKTGRGKPVPISSAALLRMRSLFGPDIEGLPTNGDAPKLATAQSMGNATNCSPSFGESRTTVETDTAKRSELFWSPTEVRRDQAPSSPPLNLSTERSESGFAAAEEVGTRIDGEQAPPKPSDKGVGMARFLLAMADEHDHIPTGASKLGYEFASHSGRTLAISSAARAKAETYFRIPSSVGDREPRREDAPGLDSSRPSSSFRSPALHFVEKTPSLTGRQSQPVSRDSAKSGRAVKPGFKAPRIISPSTNLPTREGIGGRRDEGSSSLGQQFLLPPRLQYLLHRSSRRGEGRQTLREFFNRPRRRIPLASDILSMTADSAELYKIPDADCSVGALEMWENLGGCGAEQRYASEEWVANHFKWIVWKLASLERKYAYKLLTKNNVLDELKYRYDRELSGGRSALRRVCERDSPAEQMMVLCVSAVRQLEDERDRNAHLRENGDGSGDGIVPKCNPASIIEVTDGWYRLNAHVDAPLTRLLRERKLRVGQKIVVMGATLGGSSDGLPPLEAFEGSYLTINLNGTRRGKWDEPLGFCAAKPAPLAFKCIKPDGGTVPNTYVAVTKVYPTVHREKLPGGGYVLRSGSAEEIAAQEYEKRNCATPISGQPESKQRISIASIWQGFFNAANLRSRVAEEAMVKLEATYNPSDVGTQLFAALETASSPDRLMADMTRTQLDAFASFQSRREATMQSAMGNVIREALEKAGLASREVTPTLKVRVVGLRRKGDTGSAKEGLVTIWHATEELREQIQEGEVYCVCGLRPSAPGSYHSFNSTRWRRVSGETFRNRFEFPYAPPASTRISDLEEESLPREFDTVALVLLVCDAFSRDSRRGEEKVQWLFMTDGSYGKGASADAWDEIQVLAVEFSWPEKSFISIESSIVGSVVGYRNLWCKNRDRANRLWVAEAPSDRALHSTKLMGSEFRHLVKAAADVSKWAASSPWMVDVLRSDMAELVNGRGWRAQ